MLISYYYFRKTDGFYGNKVGDGLSIENHKLERGKSIHKFKWAINVPKLQFNTPSSLPFIRNLKVLTMSALNIVSIFSLLLPFDLLLTVIGKE